MSYKYSSAVCLVYINAELATPFLDVSISPSVLAVGYEIDVEICFQCRKKNNDDLKQHLLMKVREEKCIFVKEY